jgi:diaminopimelate decarboxylase
VAYLEYNSKNELLFSGQKISDFCSSEVPRYLYSRKILKEKATLYKNAIEEALGAKADLHFALKSNSNAELLKELLALGFGVDVVSGGELKKALQVGFQGSQVVFSGAGKTKQEMIYALASGVGQFNVESPSELRRLADLSQGKMKATRVALRLNPQVNAVTHPYISTGFREHKFGIDESLISECLQILRQSPQLKLEALSCHIGSQLTDFSAFREACTKMKLKTLELQQAGFPIQSLDLGGGVGIHYQENESADLEILKNYAQVLKEEMRSFPVKAAFEPGRVISARAGILTAQIQYIKKTPYKTFVILNSGMNHLIRPALYQAYHRIFPVQRRSIDQTEKVDIVGPVCESSDFFAKDREMPLLQEGDFLAITEAGAYGMSMMSLYNDFDAPEEVWVD